MYKLFFKISLGRAILIFLSQFTFYLFLFILEILFVYEILRNTQKIARYENHRYFVRFWEDIFAATRLCKQDMHLKGTCSSCFYRVCVARGYLCGCLCKFCVNTCRFISLMTVRSSSWRVEVIAWDVNRDFYREYSFWCTVHCFHNKYSVVIIIISNCTDYHPTQPPAPSSSTQRVHENKETTKCSRAENGLIC